MVGAPQEHFQRTERQEQKAGKKEEVGYIPQAIQVNCIIYMKFWDELIARFPSIQHGATIGGYTDTSTDTHVQQFIYSCVYSLPRESDYRAVACQRKEGYTLPSICLEVHMQTHRLMGIYEIRR
jgi:hypothetical protein